MRVALVVPGGVSRDGERRIIPAILSMAGRLAADHDVQIVVPRQEPEQASWMLVGATVHNLGGEPRGWQLRAVRMLLDLHRRQPFDVFHALWARGPGEVAIAAARVARRPAIVHVAGGELVWLPEVAFGDRRAWRRALSRWVIRRAARVTAASQPMIDLVASATGVRTVRVPLGADTTVWSSDGPRRRRPGAPATLVSVASLTPVKDHTALLQATAQLVRCGRDVRVHLVGEDTSGGAIPALVRELGLEDRVELHGYLPPTAARDVVRGADLMIVTSRHEAGPVAMLEAAALGVPTVGTPVGHVAEWAPDAAVLTPFSDPSALAENVGALLDDEPRRLRLAGAARARSVAEDADWTVRQVADLYREVSQERHG
jgi:glycosyltransferase involved in cell wall biosynthesis